MGGLNSSSSETKTSKDETSTTRPLAEQMPRLERAWSEADSAYNASKANPYLGNFIIAPNAGQYKAFNDAANWTQNGARDTATAMGGYGTGQLAGGTAAQAAALSGLFGAANSDPTATNIARAQQYASQQNVSGIVDAAMYDARREAAESTLPSLYRSTSASGSLNSDRAALADGVVRRGLGETAANLSATTRSNLLNSGLTMAQADQNRALQALGAAGSLGSTMTGQGSVLTQAGFDNTGKALAGQQAAATGLNALDQSVLDNDLKKWYAQYQQPWTNLQQYYGVVGDLKGGTTRTVGTGTSETTQTPSLLSTIGQGIGVFGSLFCDMRVKTKLSGVIGTFRGHNLYAFRYTFDDSNQTHIGVMAQEIEQTRPDAVWELDGVKLVNISAL